MLESMRGRVLAPTMRRLSCSRGRRCLSDTPQLVSLSVNHADLYQAKLNRVGRALEDFKNHFEAPLKDLFAAKQRKTSVEQRRIFEQIKARLRTHRLKMKEIKKQKAKGSEEKLLIKMQEEIARDMAKDPYTMEEFVLGARPPENVDQVLDNLVAKLRDTFQMMPDERERELERSDYWLEPSYLLASNPFPGIKMLETTRIRWELALQPSELAKWVARELKEKYSIPFDENHPLLTSRDAILGPSKVSKRAFRPPFRQSTRLQWFKKQKKRLQDIADGKISATPPPALADRPAVLASRRESSLPDEGKTVHSIRQSVDDGLPVSITTYHWPYLLPRSDRFRFHQRKVVLKVKVSALKLPSAVVSRLKELAGPRYDQSSGVLKIVGTKRAERAQNKVAAFSLLRSLLTEAWKADVNFVPTADPILPHQKVERQLQEEADASALEQSLQPTSFMRPELVVFRLRSLSEPRLRAVSDILSPLNS